MDFSKLIPQKIKNFRIRKDEDENAFDEVLSKFKNSEQNNSNQIQEAHIESNGWDF